MRLLALTPHPDDEILGAGALHIALARAGHEVLVYPVTLGRRADHGRRRDELVRSCRIAGLELLDVAPLDMSVAEHDDLRASGELLAEALPAHLDGVDVVTGPSPRDVHPAHETIARSAAGAIETTGADMRLWMWSIWGALPQPTLWFPFDDDLLDHQLAALAEHRSQVARTDFQRLVRGRAEAASVLGPELLYGFGVDVPDEPYAELVCEAVHHHGVWYAGRARRLDPGDPLGGEHSFHAHTPVGSWLR